MQSPQSRRASGRWSPTPVMLSANLHCCGIDRMIGNLSRHAAALSRQRAPIVARARRVNLGSCTSLLTGITVQNLNGDPETATCRLSQAAHRSSIHAICIWSGKKHKRSAGHNPERIYITRCGHGQKSPLFDSPAPASHGTGRHSLAVSLHVSVRLATVGFGRLRHQL